MGSTINVIINTSENTSRGIKLFLDVNLKGKKLDTEDVFKSYLFSRDDNNNTFRSQWVRIKKLSSRLLISRAKQQKNLYPLMEIIRHSFYCSLYKEKYFKNIEISQDFCLSKAATILGESEAEESLHYRGEHIIEVLENQTFLTKVLKNVEDFLVMATDVVNSRAPSQDFENYFDVETGKSVDFVTVSIAHSFIKRILYDDALLPKAVLFKYFVTTLAETQKRKDDYKWIFDVYAFDILFNISAVKKQKDVVLNIVAEKKDGADWHVELSSAIQTFLCETGISRAKVSVQYKYFEEDFNEEYLSKGLAVLYNFFTISKGRCNIKNEGTLKDFLTNTNSYTLEHLIINKSKKYELNGGKDFTVRGESGKCVNSMFNFIFISEFFNGSLKNKTIREKMGVIANNMQEIKCDYSKKVLEFVQKYFIDDPLPLMKTSPFPDLTGLSYDEKIEKLDAYLSNEDNPFFKTFSEFASEVLKEVYRKVTQS